jgi:hypothetical protein
MYHTWRGIPGLGLVLSAALFVLPLQAQPHMAHLTSVVKMPVDPQVLAELTPANRAILMSRGVVVTPTGFQSATLPLVGYWLRFGQARYVTDANGIVRLPGPPSTTRNIKLYRSASDRRPLTVIPQVSVVPLGQPPVTTVVTIEYGLPRDMDSRDRIRAGPPRPPLPIEVLTCHPARAACPRVGTPGANAKGCCLDYDAPFPIGDGQPYNREGTSPECMKQGYVNFIMSTCFAWTFVTRSRACFLEKAILQVVGPTCYQNHKHRNCQTLSETDFSINPISHTMGYGEKFQFTVRNNTPSNSTCLQVTGPGKIDLKIADGRGRLVKSQWCVETLGSHLPIWVNVGGYEIHHYSDSAKKHYEDVNLVFTSPKSEHEPCSEQDYLLTASTNGLGGLLNIKVKENCSWTGTINISQSGSETVDQPLPRGVTGHNRYTDSLEHKETFRVTGSRRIGDSIMLEGEAEASGTRNRVGDGNTRWTECRPPEPEFAIGHSTNERKGEAKGGKTVRVKFRPDGRYEFTYETLDIQVSGTFHSTRTILVASCFPDPGEHTYTENQATAGSISLTLIDADGTLDRRSLRSLSGSKTFDVRAEGVPVKRTVTWDLKRQ